MTEHLVLKKIMDCWKYDEHSDGDYACQPFSQCPNCELKKRCGVIPDFKTGDTIKII